MKKSYKEFYKFVQCVSPYVTSLWEKINNSKDPKPGDIYRVSMVQPHEGMYSVMHVIPVFDMKFVRVDFDPEFKNGVAFYYIFDNNGNEVKIHSINDVYDYKKLSTDIELPFLG